LAAAALDFLVNKPSKEKVPASSEVAKPNESSSYMAPVFELELKDDAFDKIKAKRKEALAQGLLFSSRNDLVDGVLRINNKEYNCQLRLKGDLLDHLRDDKWSFRIMLKGNATWNGMNILNVHNSKSRAHNAEWIMHQLFKQEGIIAPDYDFITFKLNGKELGIYAYEHHFEDELLVKNKREFGPILKHTDDAYWENVNKQLSNFPWVAASDIELFNKEKSGDPSFWASFKTAQGMLSDFLNEKKSVHDVFDVPLMAKYYALMDLCHAWHAQQFTNIRFYLNPLTGKLEPIGYDCFGEEIYKLNADWDAFGEGVNVRVSRARMYNNGNVYRYLLFSDRAFFESYMQALDHYTTPQFIEAQKKNSFIRSDKDYKEYKDQWKQLFLKAGYTRKKLQPQPHLSLDVKRLENSQSQIELKALHNFPLELVGFGDADKLIDTLGAPLYLEAYNHKLPARKYEYRHTNDIEYLYFRTLGLKELHKLEIGKGERKTILMTAGDHTISQPLVIPSDYKLEIAAGTSVKLNQGGSIISYGSVTALGSSSHPISFYSEGESGLLISRAEGPSHFTHCQFLGLGRLYASNLNSSGAVTAYESKVNFDNCKFHKIEAPVALNCIHSELELNNTTFTDCDGVALSSKYSTVYLYTALFERIGLEGLSLVGGTLEGSGVDFKQVVGTAMTLKEFAEVYFISLGITDTNTAISVYDHCKVNISKLWLTKVDRGIEVFSNGELIAKEVAKPNFIEKGATVLIKGKRQEPS